MAQIMALPKAACLMRAEAMLGTSMATGGGAEHRVEQATSNTGFAWLSYCSSRATWLSKVRDPHLLLRQYSCK